MTAIPPVRPNPEKVARSPSGAAERRSPHVVAPLDDLRAEPRRLCHRSFKLPRVVVAVDPEEFEPREAPVDLVEDQPGSISVLDRGRVTAAEPGAGAAAGLEAAIRSTLLYTEGCSGTPDRGRSSIKMTAFALT